MNIISTIIFIMLIMLMISCTTSKVVKEKIREKLEIQYVDTTTFNPYYIIVAKNEKKDIKYIISKASNNINFAVKEGYERIHVGQSYILSYFLINSDTLKLEQKLVRKDISISYNDEIFAPNDSIHFDLYKSNCITSLYIKKNCD